VDSTHPILAVPRQIPREENFCSFTVLDLAVPLENSRTMQWYEDEEFWREMYNYMFPAEKFSAAEEQVSQIISLTENR
jgi:hypothetical protein